MSTLHKQVMAATALALGGGATTALPALADETPPRPHQGPVVEFGLEGAYLFNNSADGSSAEPGGKLGLVPSLRSGDEAASFGLSGRFNMDAHWAVEAAVSGTWLGEDSGSGSRLIFFPVFGTEAASGSFDTSYETLDLAAVWRLGDPGIGASRFDVSFGLRALHVGSNAAYEWSGPSSNGALEVESDAWLGGPRIGLSAALPLGERFSLFGSVSGAVLIGQRWSESDTLAGGSVDEEDFTTAYNLEGAVGIDFRIADGVSLGAGYKAQQIWNAGVHYDEIDKGGNYEADDADLLVHGAFVRLNLAF